MALSLSLYSLLPTIFQQEPGYQMAWDWCCEFSMDPCAVASSLAPSQLHRYLSQRGQVLGHGTCSAVCSEGHVCPCSQSSFSCLQIKWKWAFRWQPLGSSFTHCMSSPQAVCLLVATWTHTNSQSIGESALEHSALLLGHPQVTVPGGSPSLLVPLYWEGQDHWGHKEEADVLEQELFCD